ncbi:type II secretion system protein [bacterium]|nr:type II secretion system protein [bacterium]
MQRNKKAFTIVEVLITIGIIGVVAAITIPVLMQNTNSKKFTTQFKKSLSTLNQAAINAQAQYDMNYSLLDDASSDSSCETDTLAANNKTMCGLFNNTLSGHTYQGVYGSIGGTNSTGKYSYTTKSSIDPSGFLIYALADGSMIGFNPDARNCSLGVGNVLNSSMLAKTPTNSDATGLANCLGFIDVNGVNPPNREVTCADGTTELNPSSLCEIKSTGTSVGDVYPIVFHDGTVEPATNAAMSALLGEVGKGSGEAATGQEEQQTPKYDLSTPEGRKRADVDNMENIANAFKKAFIDNELPMDNSIDSVQFTVYGKDNGGDTKLSINTKYSGGSIYDAIQSGLPEIIKNSGVDLDNIKVNSSDDKWKYGYTINYDRKTNTLSIWARGKNDNSSNGIYWFRQTDITESDRQ